MSAEDLAMRLGRTKTFIYRIEQEVQEPTIDQVNALAAVLPVSVEDVLTNMGARLHSPAAMARHYTRQAHVANAIAAHRRASPLERLGK